MHENETTVLIPENTSESAEHAPASVPESVCEKPTRPSIPKPVFMRLFLLFGGGVGCLIVGIFMSVVTGDLVLLFMSAILFVSFVAKGFLLKRKINAAQIYSVSGVCVSCAPKMLGRYKRIELVDTKTGGEVNFVMPKKVVFKVGHVYTCYFDNDINNRTEIAGKSHGDFFGMDLPTSGFLGCEDFGIYQEKPATTATADDKNKEEKQ
ncbi:MAG: hypothetical protein FWF81_11970 [Defluviitaleaceae bacterium]|nr:hypothetical protein [Defluviitaleaceae bacterium]